MWPHKAACLQDEIFFQLCAKSKQLSDVSNGALSFITPLIWLFRVCSHFMRSDLGLLLAAKTISIHSQAAVPVSGLSRTLFYLCISFSRKSNQPQDCQISTWLLASNAHLTDI